MGFTIPPSKSPLGIDVAPASPSPGRRSVAWIASFPRSGNTFTRTLLANYLCASDAPYRLNKLADLIPSDTCSRIWDNINLLDCDDETWWKYRRFVLNAFRLRSSDRPFTAVKTHTGNYECFGAPAFDFRDHDRVIYVVRHPLDVAVSYAAYNNITIDGAIEEMLMHRSLMRDTVSGARELRGSWSEHVTSWVKRSPCPVLVVRFDQLRENTALVLRDILKFLDIKVDPIRVIRAVEFSTFDMLRRQEEETPFIENLGLRASERFFRVGRCGQWLTEMDPSQACRLANGCGSIMQELGFSHPKDVYFDGQDVYQASRI